MNAKFSSDRKTGYALISIEYKDSEKTQAEHVISILDAEGFECTAEDTHKGKTVVWLGVYGWTIRDVRESWKEAKKQAK